MATEPQDPSTEALPVWHARSAAEVAQALGTDPDRGLSSAEAAQRLAQHGPNLLAAARREPRWTELIESLAEPLQLLLIAVGVIYALLGELEDALTILAVILTVAVVETLSEARAKGAIAALRTLSAPTASVLREGTAVEVAAAEVVPGDVVLLEAGDRVVADLRLVQTAALRLDESSLTGESVPVAKDAAAAPPLETELGERRTMAFAGTTLTAGKGRGLVVATGRTTELGRIAGLTESARDTGTPLQVQMKQLAGWLVWVALASSLLVPVLGVFVAGRPVQEMLLTSLTLAFATIPEELPILITIVLGLGAYRLAQEGVIVKRLRAAEALGSVSTIGTDKTGTLTENRMRLAEVFVPDGTTQPLPGVSSPTAPRRVLEIGVLASDAQAQHRDSGVDFVGDPTETALLTAAEDSGLMVATVRSAAHVLTEYPFDDVRKRLSVVVEQEGQRWLLLKGAPESVLAICSREGQPAALDQARQEAEAMAARGLRVLGFAERRLTPREPLPAGAAAVEHDLVFVGLAGLADPPRPEVPAAVDALKAAGVRVLMLTGDHPATARAIAEKVGIDAAQVLRGRDLDQFNEVELRQVVADTSVFARITPEHKLRLVRALQERGDVVAVTGDGVNDGPALREAAVGVAMGKAGTDVAREAADLVLADDNFATVTTAVRGGRTLYANLRKAVRYYLAAKVALVTASLVAVAARLPVPFAPVQIIVLELFMDLGASTTFVSEPPEDDLMARPPRDTRRVFMDHPMQLGILAGGLSLAAAVVVPYLWVWRQGGDLVQAQTAAFVAWMLGHIVLAAHMRAERQPLLRTNLFGNRPFLVWAAAAVALVAFGLGVPFVEARLHVAPLTASTWAVALACALLFPSWCEVWKWARRWAGVRS